MQVIENLKVKEKVYIETLENGLTVLIIPKKETEKKFIIWGTNFGSINSKFIAPGENEITTVPDGVAHFLEHKLFEQKNGTNSLDTLTAIGVDANAYTTTDHTAYLYECNDKFYEALDEFMDYVQNPYFTKENVEKEKGIIGQEIRMYDDHPGWQVYINAMQCLYQNNPVRIDIAGSIESISNIDKDILYKSYNTFYHPSNMCLVVCGNFEAEAILEEIKKRLLPKEILGEIQRIYPEEPEKVANKECKKQMEVSTPIFVIGIKDKVSKENMVKKHIAIEILLNMIIGKSSKLYQTLYKQGLLLEEPDMQYEWSKEYAHITISAQSKDPKKVYQGIADTIQEYMEHGLKPEHFDRIKRKIYGDYVKEFDDVADIARMFLADWMKGVNSFSYLEQYNAVTKSYAEEILKEVFLEDKTILSVVEPNSSSKEEK